MKRIDIPPGDPNPRGLAIDQIIQGDCIEILNSFPDRSIDLIFADPPYYLQLRQDLWRPNLTKVNRVDDSWDQFSDWEVYDRFSQEWLTACRRVLKDSGTIWVIGTYHNIYRLGALMQNLGFWFLNDVVWIKCLAGDTEVLALVNGIPLVSTIKDLIRIDLSNNSIQLPSYEEHGCFTWVDLIGWQKNPKTKGLRIQLKDGHWMECTAEHKFPIARDGFIENVRADELTPGDHLLQLGRFQLPQVIESEGIDRQIGEFVGWYLAEGSLLHNDKGIVLSLSANESTEAEKLIEVVRGKTGVVGRIHIYKNSLHLIFPGRFISEFIRRFVRGEGAKSKRLNREALFYGTDFLEGILEGYLKGDGHWDEKNQRWRLGFSRNKGLVIDLSILCRLLGYRLRFNEGFVPYKDSKVEIIRGEIRDNRDGKWDFASLRSLGLPTRGGFDLGQSHSLAQFRKRYKIITRKSKNGTMTEVGRMVLDSDLRLAEISHIQETNLKTYYDLSVDSNHIFALANGILTHNSNPMPNFRGVRFTNAHETLLWATKTKGARYTFNYHAMKNLNDGIQMRSDWWLPICTGKERIHVDGKKAHSTQKPEALLYRIIMASSNPGDIVLDPFFGTGTTGVVAKRLLRHWVGIEKEERYIQIASKRLQDTYPESLDPSDFEVNENKRRRTRIPFNSLIENGLLKPGQSLYFKGNKSHTAIILPDGRLAMDGTTGSIHQIGKLLTNGVPYNGWEHWHYEASGGELKSINELRESIRDSDNKG